MTDNEKRILDVLSRAGPLSKRDITSRCAMSWATAVKMVARLEEQGFVRPEGIERQKNAGAPPTMYALSPKQPVALGIDLEYGRVHASIRNLRGEILEDRKLATPAFGEPEDLIAFLAGLAQDFIVSGKSGELQLEGIGIGLPNHLFDDGVVPGGKIESELGERFGIPVRVDNNIRCFAQAVARFEPTGGSILVVTIRSGIGVGIVIDGKVYQGERGRAGELGHILVDPHGRRCRCGKIGCLETIVNRDVLALRARETLGLPESAEDGRPILHALFSGARRGDAKALAIVTDAAKHLGEALARLLLVMDIGSVLLYAAFGPDGEILVPLLEEVIQSEVYPGLEFKLRYRELDEDSYVTGAAYLVLRDFVTR